MNILIIGNGGREHSICWAVSENPKCQKVYCIPGSDGISHIAECVKLDIFNSQEIIKFCNEFQIDLVIIGPEGPLENGLADKLVEANILTFGPTKHAAKLESSKLFTKEICQVCNAPTARFEKFDSIEVAKAFIKKGNFPLVIKRNGLAAGKGVTIVENVEQGLETLNDLLSSFETGEEVIIEEFVDGEEVSLFVISDGINCLSLGGAQDYKKLKDGDQGPNTGGMGAYSPTPILTVEFERVAMRDIVEPTIKEMARRGTPFKGLLYAGLMISNGKPKLIEYNVRFGDPECQVLMMRLGAQILDIILDCVEDRLPETKVNWADDHALTVVLTSKGYPKDYKSGSLIKNLGGFKESSNLKIFHAGTRKISKSYYSNGGRVLNITARGTTLEEARETAYEAISEIGWEECFFRKDIGYKDIGN